MDRYTKGFVVASLVYFFLAAVLGIWMGGTDAAGWVRFAHVHFNLLGFMSMMIYGVGYFILPRFNGRTLRWPSWVPAHFYAANLGLIGMVATAPSLPLHGLHPLLGPVGHLGGHVRREPRGDDADGAERGGGGGTLLRAGSRSARCRASRALRERRRTATRRAEDRPGHAGGRDPHPVAADRGRLRGTRLRLPREPGAPRAGEADPDHACGWRASGTTWTSTTWCPN